jgi:hypothetical protein
LVRRGEEDLEISVAFVSILLECMRGVVRQALYCKDLNGSTSTKYLDLRQNGTVITGHFKGPNQAGAAQGTIEEQHLVVV